MNNKLELEFKILVEESDPSCVVGFKRTWEHVVENREIVSSRRILRVYTLK
ncbi:hypothetical protein Bca52824_089157 [Brassica carinata]|uniref:Uncharacterized protein n=1 Tax=Brassica carinata TaxID=52824 RepID=A0A8X7PBK6_BRACI|nr:hypothetical protein Bca52824_089157 [Brassica carinata]